MRMKLMSFEGTVVGWLKDFDVDANAGKGSVSLTQIEAEAMEFPDFTAAMEAWRKQSAAVPLRPDGKPNRPLTAYHASFEKG